ncbi:hypothetical protein BS50DRAFT_605305 [Corynespora cassiicola Philippines]|uniref:NTF2-like protein n=1 Tax=Corynespora cassiicola Philippines TaxID=1448308 RepID=A0A2T2N2T8_CORCC|nr:hypothetical protein BS50DRAFT_605305 [Corynespora cassiicola Philippines]
MTLAARYQAFLASPTASALADNASLHYITTLTSLHDAPAILKHLAVQEKLLKKKAEKVLSTVEGPNGLSLDVETTLEFVAGGGAFLPGLDDNFVSDRTVTFPMVHIVHFDKDQKIDQIRLYWDQGSLLKQVDVIGARARNWPIRDGKEQTRLIATTAAVLADPDSATPSRRSTTSRGSNDVSGANTRRSTNNAMNDPHATLSLFEARSVEESSYSSQSIAPRAQSAKPPPRDLSEVFVGEGDEGTDGSVTSDSPNKQGIPVKSGAGKNFKPNRLFDEAEEEHAAATPLSVRTNPKKYSHFEFGDEGEATPKVRETSRPPTKSKHTSQWGFEDFVTPDKPKPKVLGQNVRHFGWSDDEVGPFFQPQSIEVAPAPRLYPSKRYADVMVKQDEGSPVRRPVVHKARPDSEAHFDFVDEATPEAQRQQPSQKGRNQSKNLGLYTDHVLDAESAGDDGKQPLSDVTTAIKNENRKKDFGSQWEMADNSPATKPNEYKINIAGNGMGGRKGTESTWSLYDESPEQSKKENVRGGSGIRTTGDGMGGRKGADKSFWDF